MMYRPPDDAQRYRYVMALIGTVLLVTIGIAIWNDLGASMLPGVGMVTVAIAIAAISPAAGIAGPLIALPTVYALHPMPRGEFTLLELAIVTAVLGISLRALISCLRGGWAQLGSLLTPAHFVIPAVMLILATGVSLLTLADPAYRTESLREVRTVIVEPLAFALVARWSMRDRFVRNWAGAMLILAGLAVSLDAMYQVLIANEGVAAGDLRRATSLYTHPNNLGLYLERVALLTLAIGIVNPSWYPAWIIAAIQLAALGLTFSRGAFLGLAAGVALLLILRRSYRWLVLLGAAGASLAIIAWLLFPDRIADVGGSGAEPTRFGIWRASWEMVKAHPLFGVGPDQFLYQYARRFLEPAGWPERYTSHPHNMVLDAWLRLGVLGLATFATLAAAMLWWVMRWVRPIRQDIWSLGAVAALVAAGVHGMVDQAFFLADLATFTWLFVILLVTVPTGPAPSPKPERASYELTWPEPRAMARGAE